MEQTSSAWLRKHGYLVTLGVLLALVLVVLPAILVAISWKFQAGPLRPVLEFLTGTWPAQQYQNPNPEQFRDSSWLYLGIVLRSWIVFATPVIIGLFLWWLLRGIERRLIGMLLGEYLGFRDTFIQTEVFREFVGPVTKAGITEEDFDSRLRDVFKKADGVWRQSQSQKITEVLEKLSV